MSWVNGKSSQSVIHTYLIMPKRKGIFEVGPFFADYRGKIYKAEAVSLTVNGGLSSSVGSTNQNVTKSVYGKSAYSSGPSISTTPENTTYDSDNVFLTMEVGKREVYINEVVPVTVKLYVNLNETGLKEIAYPSYAHEGFAAGKIPEPEKRTQIIRGTNFKVIVFNQDIFGIKEGDYVLGPARLSCKAVVRERNPRRSAGFSFSVGGFLSDRFNALRSFPIELEADPVPVTILPFPGRDRPSDFQGAVGNYNMDVYVDKSQVNVGDPVVVRITITGKGNMDTVTVPNISQDSNFKTYEPQVKKKGNRKIYEQIFIPKTVDATELPKVSFSFFNPSSGKYKTIAKGPFSIEVVARPESDRVVKMVSVPGVSEMLYPKEELGEDIIYITENIGELRQKGHYLYMDSLFWIGQSVPIALFLIFYITYRRKEKMSTDERYARFLKAPRRARKALNTAAIHLQKGEIILFYDSIFKTFQEYFSGRLGLPMGNITSQIIESKLKNANCGEKHMNMIRDIFNRCEMARYASSVSDKTEAEEVLKNTKMVMDHMNRLKLI